MFVLPPFLLFHAHARELRCSKCSCFPVFQRFVFRLSSILDIPYIPVHTYMRHRRHCSICARSVCSVHTPIYVSSFSGSGWVRSRLPPLASWLLLQSLFLVPHPHPHPCPRPTSRHPRSSSLPPRPRLDSDCARTVHYHPSSPAAPFAPVSSLSCRLSSGGTWFPPRASCHCQCVCLSDVYP